MPKRKGLSKSLINYIFDRDNGECTYCEMPGIVVDHVIPVSRGGNNFPSNLVLACVKCNGKKGAKLEIEWLTMAYFRLLSVGEDISWLDGADVQ